MNFIKYYYHHKPQISATTKLTRCQTDTSYKDEYIKLERNNINESFSKILNIQKLLKENKHIIHQLYIITDNIKDLNFNVEINFNWKNKNNLQKIMRLPMKDQYSLYDLELTRLRFNDLKYNINMIDNTYQSYYKDLLDYEIIDNKIKYNLIDNDKKLKENINLLLLSNFNMNIDVYTDSKECFIYLKYIVLEDQDNINNLKNFPIYNFSYLNHLFIYEKDIGNIIKKLSDKIIYLKLKDYNKILPSQKVEFVKLNDQLYNIKKYYKIKIDHNNKLFSSILFNCNVPFKYLKLKINKKTYFNTPEFLVKKNKNLYEINLGILYEDLFIAKSLKYSELTLILDEKYIDKYKIRKIICKIYLKESVLRCYEYNNYRLIHDDSNNVLFKKK
jgi:hypothetical protein